jgi:hypothetical protein
MFETSNCPPPTKESPHETENLSTKTIFGLEEVIAAYERDHAKIRKDLDDMQELLEESAEEISTLNDNISIAQINSFRDAEFICDLQEALAISIQENETLRGLLQPDVRDECSQTDPETYPEFAALNRDLVFLKATLVVKEQEKVMLQSKWNEDRIALERSWSNQLNCTMQEFENESLRGFNVLLRKYKALAEEVDIERKLRRAADRYIEFQFGNPWTMDHLDLAAPCRRKPKRVFSRRVSIA